MFLKTRPNLPNCYENISLLEYHDLLWILFVTTHTYFFPNTVLRSFVFGQMVGSVERFLTDVALVIVGSLMQFFVLIQMIPPVEALRTICASERFDGRMRSLMTFQVIGPGEFFLANVAFVHLWAKIAHF